MKTDNILYRLAARPLLAAAILLTVPLAATQVSGQVAWDLADYAFMGTLVVGTGVLFELAAMKTDSTPYRAAVGVALAAVFLLVWVIRAVGIIGAAGDRADLVSGGVLAVGVVGAVLARFRPRGMARAMSTTALAQLLVAGIVLIAGWVPAYNHAYEILGVSGTFAALWLTSAWLFRKAAGDRPSAGAMEEG